MRPVPIGHSAEGPSGASAPVYSGVYAVGHAGLTPEGRWLAAVKACGKAAVLSHSSSLMLFGLLPVADGRPEVTVPHARRRAPADIRVHRTRVLDPRRVAPSRHPDDIAGASDPRRRSDNDRQGTAPSLRHLVSRAQAARLASLPALAQRLDRAAGRPGAPRGVPEAARSARRKRWP